MKPRRPRAADCLGSSGAGIKLSADWVPGPTVNHKAPPLRMTTLCSLRDRLACPPSSPLFFTTLCTSNIWKNPKKFSEALKMARLEAAQARSLDFWWLLWALSTRPHYLPGVAQASCRLWARHGGGGNQESKKKKWEWGERSHLEAWEPDQWRKVQLPPHWCYQIWNLRLFSSSSNKGLSEWPGLSRTLPAVLTAPVEGWCSRAADPACSLALSTTAGSLLRWALLPVATAGRPGWKGPLQLSGLAQSPAVLPGFLFHSLLSALALRMQPDLLFDRCENEPSPLPPPEVSASGWHLL